MIQYRQRQRNGLDRASEHPAHHRLHVVPHRGDSLRLPHHPPHQEEDRPLAAQRRGIRRKRWPQVQRRGVEPAHRPFLRRPSSQGQRLPGVRHLHRALHEEDVRAERALQPDAAGPAAEPRAGPLLRLLHRHLLPRRRLLRLLQPVQDAPRLRALQVEQAVPREHLGLPLAAAADQHLDAGAFEHAVQAAAGLSDIYEGRESEVLAGLGGVLELLFLLEVVEQLRVLDLEQGEDVLELLGDDLFVHLDLGEAVDDVVLDVVVVELVEVEGEEDDALVLEVLEDVEAVAADLVDHQHAAEVVHLLLAQVDLLRQHLQQAPEIEIQLLRLLYLLESLLVHVRQVHVVQVLLRTQLDLYVAQRIAAMQGHDADLHHLLEALHLAAAHLPPHLDREARLEERHPVAALHYRVQVRHPRVLALVVQLMHLQQTRNAAHTTTSQYNIHCETMPLNTDFVFSF